MKTKEVLVGAFIPTFLLSSLFGGAITSQASSTSLGGTGSVSVTGTEKTAIRDPEHPDTIVDPGPGPSTTGDLRIDFVSALNFPVSQITKTNRTYDSLAQLFHSDTSARGYYIQLTDQRVNADGWTLTLTQDTQFESTIIQELDKQQLTGAVLSFDKGWANAPSTDTMPTVTRDTLSIDKMGTAYTVASAEKGQGIGIWTIAFGASSENVSNQETTLTALTDVSGNAITDATFNKPAYTNSAVSLTIPETTKIYPVQYTTTLTWTLEAGPTG